MLEIVVEKMLTDYYKTCLAMGRYVNPNKIFDVFIRINDVGPDRAEQLRTLVNSSVAAELTNDRDCNMYYRSCQILRMRGQEIPLSDLQQQLIAIKVNAIRQLTQEGLCATPNATAMQLWQNLYGAAEEGIVDALRIGGLLLAEGMLPYKNHNGNRWLHAAASWLDYTSLLYMLRSGDSNSYGFEFNYETTLYRACEYFEFPHVGKSAVEDVNNLNYSHNGFLLIEAVKALKVDLNKINPLYHKIIYSHNLTENDKEKLVVRNEYSEKELSLLPTDTGYPTVGPEALLRRSESFRSKECRQIADLYLMQKQSTIGIVCDDIDMLDQYDNIIVAAHRGARNEHVETIDVSYLNQSDFEPTVNNVFLRKCVNGFFNVLILRMSGHISSEILKRINDFLENKNRYRINKPDVVLNLSDVLVYCLCDEQNMQQVFCNAKIHVTPMSCDEKKNLIRETEKKICVELHKGNESRLSDEMVSQLSHYSLKLAERVVAEILRQTQDCEAPTVELMSNLLKEYGKEKADNNFGFGGYKQ